jgi:hypothetical protein
MVERGVWPWPMVYDNTRQDLLKFQKYVVRRWYVSFSWEDYIKYIPRNKSDEQLIIF